MEFGKPTTTVAQSKSGSCREEGRRSRAASAEAPDGNAEAFCLVGEVLADSRTWEDHDADRHSLEDSVVALERRGLVVSRPFGLEGYLRDLAGLGPAGCDAFGAPRTAAVQHDH